MTYKDRLMSIRKSKKTTSATDACAPVECGQMFGIIAEGLDDLKTEVSEARKDIGAVNERIAAQEAKTHSAWHSISRIETRLNKLPKDNAESIARHEAGCPGRDYARLKLKQTTTSSSIPMKQTGSYETGGAPTPEFSMATVDKMQNSLQIPKWVVYLGAGLGAAIIACGYAMNMFGLFGNGTP